MNSNESNEEVVGLIVLNKFREDFNNAELNFWDFIKYKSNVDLGFAFCKLFFPEFVQVDECVFLAEMYNSQAYQDWREKFGGDRMQLESIINHVHIYDLFEADEESDDLDEKVWDGIAKYLVKSWMFALNEMFPDREFFIRHSNDPDEYGPTITFYQLNHGQLSDDLDLS